MHFWRHRYPPGLEAEGLELPGEFVTDSADAGKVHGARADVDDLLEEAGLLRIVRADIVEHGLLGFREGLSLSGGAKHQQGNDSLNLHSGATEVIVNA